MGIMREWIRLVESEATVADEMVDAFDQEFERSPLNGLVTVSIRRFPPSEKDHVELSYIGTKKGERGKGYANRAMAMLCDFADRFQVVLTLGVATDADGRHDSLSFEKLMEWYMSWGFEGVNSSI